MPEWLKSHEIRLFHRELIEEHGGSRGISDEGALEATLARPRNLLAYDPEALISRLAASYGFGLIKNHVFVDGNKRIALAAINIFLQINGATLTANELEAVVVINEVATGDMDENALAKWIDGRTMPFDLDAK